MKKLLLLGLLLACSSAQAFQIKAKSDNPLFSEAQLTAAVQRISGEIGTRIPDDSNIKVFVYSKKLDIKNGQVLYLYRVQLRKAFAGKAPYAYAGYIPIDSNERYGFNNAQGASEDLDRCLREFFTKFKTIDPNQPFE